MINKLFELVGQTQIVDKNEIFEKAWMINQEQAIKTIKVGSLPLLTFAKCLK